MKILVIDDSEAHRTAAMQLFADHDITVCGDHDAALELLEPRYDEERRKTLSKEYEASGMSWRAAFVKSLAETRLPYWDAVLCDLLMPAGRNAQGSVGFQHVGKEMPVGWSLALVAVKSGAQFVAVATDMNHHNHPASAMLDPMNRHVFVMDGAKVLFTNHVRHVGITGTEQVCPNCTNGRAVSDFDGHEYDCDSCGATGHNHREYGKDWKRVLDECMGSTAEKTDGAG